MKSRMFLLSAWLAFGPGCEQRMADEGRIKPLEPSDFFEDGMSARPPVPGTVAQGQARLDEHEETGRVGGEAAKTFPFTVTRAVLERGRERYDIFCAPCHDRTGGGDGMIVRRGYRPPPSFHQERLREAPPGHVVDVITRGFGAMPDYAAAVPPRDRWAIAAYVRALQLSQNARIEDVPPSRRRELK